MIAWRSTFLSWFNSSSRCLYPAPVIGMRSIIVCPVSGKDTPSGPALAGLPGADVSRCCYKSLLRLDLLVPYGGANSQIVRLAGAGFKGGVPGKFPDSFRSRSGVALQRPHIEVAVLEGFDRLGRSRGAGDGGVVGHFHGQRGAPDRHRVGQRLAA